MQQKEKRKVPSPTFNQLLQCLHSVDLNLSIERIPEKVLLLMGETKAGKTTLLYYLLSKKLVLQLNSELGIMQMRPQAICFNSYIGNGYDSTTVYPNIPTEMGEGEDECLIIDMPGFNDTRPLYRFLNIYIIRAVINNIKSVHVSFVLPYESLEGDILLQALEKSCLLLSSDFLRAQRSFSFILTKIEERQRDKQVFQLQMQQLRESQPESRLAQVLNTFQQRNTYIFCNSQPDLQQGAQLKKQIIRENQFYPREQDLLAEDYASVIIGRGNLQPFNQFLQSITLQLTQYYPLCINLLTQMVKYQHREVLSRCGNSAFDLDLLAQQLEPLNLENASLFSIEAIEFATIEEDLKSFALKMKKKEIQAQGQTQKMLQELKCFSDYSQFLSTEPCSITVESRVALHQKLKACFIMTQILASLDSKMEIKNQIDAFFQSSEIKEAIQSYFELVRQQSFLDNMMQMPEAAGLMDTDQEFRSVISSYDSKYAQLSSNIKIIQIQQPVKNQITKKNFADTILQCLKDIKPTTIQLPSVNSLRLNSQQERQLLITQIPKLPNNHLSLSLILNSLSQLPKVTLADEEKKFVNCLLRKALKILSLLHLIQYAIIFALCIPDLNQLQSLIQTGLMFRQISPDFIKGVLLPYFVQVQIDIQMVQRLHSQLIVITDSVQQISNLEYEFVQALQRIRELSQRQSQFQKKRFNFQFIQQVIEGQGLIMLLSEAKQRCYKLSRCALSVAKVQKQIIQLQRIG